MTEICEKCGYEELKYIGLLHYEDGWFESYQCPRCGTLYRREEK